LSEVDREGLRAWYRNAMRGRVAELEAIRSALASGDPGARPSARALGQELRGSGGSFGFPQITEMGALLEEGPDASAFRHIEGALAVLRAVAWPDDSARQQRNSWLAAAAAVELAQVPASVEAAWAAVGKAAGLDEDDLARRVGAHFSLEVADLERADPLAVRLVPPATCVAWSIVPLAEDDIHIRVATADPTDLRVETALMHLTGRIPFLEIAPPGRIRKALAGIEGTPTPPPPSTADTQPVIGRTTVLVVDDDRGARLMAATVLTRKGFGVVEAGGGAEALDVIAARSDVRLVVVDLDMPGMGGLELVRRLRAEESTLRLPVVVLTGAEDPLMEASLIEEGADDYIRKPLDPRLFLARVRATLRRAGVRGPPATSAAPPATTVETR
jgi:CheY-like chemotaxis protein